MSLHDAVAGEDVAEVAVLEPTAAVALGLKVWREAALVLGGVEDESGGDLAEVGLAADGLTVPAGGGEGGEEDGDQDGDNADHHEQFDQSEGAARRGKFGCRLRDIAGVVGNIGYLLLGPWGE